MHQRIPLNLDNNDLLYISLTQIDETFKASVHSHPNLEVLLVTDGEGFIQTTSHQRPVKKGDLVFINPNYNHQEISNEKLRFYAIGLNKTSVFSQEKFTRNIISISLENEDYTSFHSLYSLLYTESSFRKENYPKMLANILSSLEILFDRISGIYLNNSSNVPESDLVSNIKSIIDNNYTMNIRLKDISSRLLVSESQLCHEFKKETGLSIIEYKIKKQLEEAHNLLDISDMSISQIAFSVGFNNVSYFNKMFKKEYQKTPKEYRKEN